MMVMMRVQRANGEGGRYGPELVIERSDEEALQLLVSIVLTTGKDIMEMSGNMLQQGRIGGREKGWMKINMERWNTLASQTQEVGHMYIMTKGACRWCSGL